MNDLDIDAKQDDCLVEDALYEHDFVSSVDEQARLLHAQQFASLDLPNLIEEIEARARSDRRELRNRLTVLLAHLLKCQYQPERKSSGLLGAIVTQRSKIDQLLCDSPSLAPLVMDVAANVYAHALRIAQTEMGLPASCLPDKNPFSRNDILDQDFIP